MSQTSWYIQQLITSIFFLLGVLMILRVIIQLFTKRLFAHGRNLKLVSGLTWWVSIVYISSLGIWIQFLLMQSSQGLELINFWLLLQLYVTIYFDWRGGFFYLLVNMIFQVAVAGNERLTLPVILIFLAFQLLISILVTLQKHKKINVFVVHSVFLIIMCSFYFYATTRNGLTPGTTVMELSEALFYAGSLILLDWIVYFTLSQFDAEDLYVNTILQQANTDWLTSLNNHGSFVEQLARDFKQWQDSNEPLSMIALDIDHFKSLNDGYGHLTGNKVLSEVSATMATIINRVPRAKSYRVGGDEFNIVLPNRELHQAGEIAEKLKESLNNLTFTSVDGEELIVTLSMGVATASLNDVTPDSFYDQADQMLYHSKARR